MGSFSCSLLFKSKTILPSNPRRYSKNSKMKKMGSFGFWVLFVIAGFNALQGMAPAKFGCKIPDPTVAGHEDAKTMDPEDPLVVLSSRKLKEASHDVTADMNKRDMGVTYIEDYPDNDPPPSIVSAIKGGTIEHGTPLMPYVPRPTPPPHAKHGSP